MKLLTILLCSIKASEVNDAILTKEAMDNVVEHGGKIQCYGRSIKRRQADFSLRKIKLDRQVQLNLLGPQTVRL
ncbi:hypothetical protein KC887_04620 [Candidatus Kaiserbacteria bacterium]|nr:hypothetical protein [Candidatus Kaiserbacteria bacterium]